MDKLLFWTKININKVFFKLISSFLVNIGRHTQSNQNNEFAISLQYLKKDARDEVDFLHADICRKFIL